MSDLDRVKRHKAIAIIKSERRQQIGDGLLRDLDQCSSGELFSHLLRRGYIWARSQNNFVKQLGLPLGGMMEKLSLEKIRLDGGTQSRAGTDMSTISEYAEAMKAGAQFPPVIVIYDGADYWLGDGFHRCAAAKQAELTDIAADVRQGTRRDAVLLSVSANANHGLRRTHADKRRSVETLLRDDEWRQWSDREIGRRVSVDHKTVATVRADLVRRGEIPILDSIKAQRGDSEYTVTKNSYPPVPSQELDVEAARQIALEIVAQRDREQLRHRLEEQAEKVRNDGTRYWVGTNTVEINGEKLKVGKNQIAVMLTTVNGVGLYRFDAFQLWDWAQEREALLLDSECVKELLSLSARGTAWIDIKVARKLLKYGLVIQDGSSYTITGGGRHFVEFLIQTRPALKLEQEIRSTLKPAELYGYRTGEGEAALIKLYDLQFAKHGWVRKGEFYAGAISWLQQFEKLGHVNQVTRNRVSMWGDDRNQPIQFFHITETGCQLLGRIPLATPEPLPDLPWHHEASCFVPSDAVFNAQVGDRVEQNNLAATVLEHAAWPVLVVRTDTPHGTNKMFDNHVTVLARAVSPEVIQSRCDEIRNWALGVGLAKATTIFDEKKQLYILYATDSSDPRVMQKFVVGGYTTVDLENISADVRSFIADLDSVVSDPAGAAQTDQQPLQPVSNEPLKKGDVVITRTGHEGEIITINGGLARVQTAHMISDHKLNTLTRAEGQANKYVNPDLMPGDWMRLPSGSIVKCYSRDYLQVCYHEEEHPPQSDPNLFNWIPADTVTKVDAPEQPDLTETINSDNNPKLAEAFEAIDIVEGHLLQTKGEDEFLDEVIELLEHARHLLGVRLGIIREEEPA